MERIIAGAELEIRPGDFLALARGRVMRLSVREIELLTALARRPGRILTRQELYGQVWGGQLRDDDRSVDVYVHKLRSKLARALPDHRFIHTHFGLGYRFAPEAVADAGTGGVDAAFTPLSQLGNESVTGSAASTATLAA